MHIQRAIRDASTKKTPTNQEEQHNPGPPILSKPEFGIFNLIPLLSE